MLLELLLDDPVLLELLLDDPVLLADDVLLLEVSMVDPLLLDDPVLLELLDDPPPLFEVQPSWWVRPRGVPGDTRLSTGR